MYDNEIQDQKQKEKCVHFMRTKEERLNSKHLRKRSLIEGAIAEYRQHKSDNRCT